MKNNPLVSIMIPVYNVEKTLDACLQSIMNQDYSDIEVVIVDDGSIDSSADIIKNWQKKMSYLKSYRIKNMGVSNARNQCVSHSNADYLTFIDPDDTVDSDYVSYLVNLITSSNTQIASCQHRTVFPDGNVIDYQENKKDAVISDHDWLSRVLCRDHLDLSCWGKIYKKELFDGIEYPKGKLFEDTAVTYQLVMKSKQIKVGYQSKYNYQIRHSKTSITRSTFSLSKLDLVSATDSMVSVVTKKYPDLYKEGIQRKNWAYFSTLTSLVSSFNYAKYITLAEKLRKKILFNFNENVFSRYSDNRNRVATILLLFGLPVFKFCLSKVHN